MSKHTKTRRIDVLDKQIFELARELPDRMPEPFIALEEYDRTGKLPINFSIEPALYEGFKDYCERRGRKISRFVVKAMERKLAANI